MTPTRFRLFASLGHGINDLYFFVLPLVLPLLLREFALSYRLAGLVLASFLGVVSVCSYLFGRVSDRFSPWLLLGGGFLLASAGFLVGSLAPVLAAVLPLLAVGAVGAATYHPVVYALIDRLTPHRPGRALGSFEFWGGAAILAMYLGGGALLKALGWRGVLVLVGAPGLAMGALFLAQAAGPPLEPEGRPQAAVPAASGPANATSDLGFFLLSCLLRFLSVTAVINFLPTYLTMERHLSPSLAAYAAAFLFAGGNLSSLLMGRAADRYPPLAVLLVSAGGIAPLIFLFSLPLPLWAALGALFLLGGFQSGGGPAQNVILARLGSRLGRGTVFGLLMAIISLIGALSPALFGLLADRLGLAATMKLFALPALAGWLTLAAFTRVTRRRVVV